MSKILRINSEYKILSKDPIIRNFFILSFNKDSDELEFAIGYNEKGNLLIARVLSADDESEEYVSLLANPGMLLSFINNHVTFLSLMKSVEYFFAVSVQGDVEDVYMLSFYDLTQINISVFDLYFGNNYSLV